MHPMVRMACAILACGLLWGCGTAEYYETRNRCAVEWEHKIPPRYEQQIVQRTRFIEVPTGDVTCTRSGSGEVTCSQKTRQEAVPYTEVERVDVMKPEREARVGQCVRRQCLQAFGNVDCET